MLSANASFSSAVFAGAGMRHACFLPSWILELVRSEKLVLPFSSRGLCLFLKNHFRQHRSLPSSSLQGKAHEKMNVLHGGGSRPPFLQDSSTPLLRGDSRGCFEMFEGKKKKAHTLLYVLSIRQPMCTNGQRHCFHFIRQRNQESTLNWEKTEPSPPVAFFWLMTQRPSHGRDFGF